MGNVEAPIAYRQNVPASAELVCGVAGYVRPAWITSQRALPWRLGLGTLGAGYRRRGQEPIVDTRS